MTVVAKNITDSSLSVFGEQSHHQKCFPELEPSFQLRLVLHKEAHLCPSNKNAEQRYSLLEEIQSNVLIHPFYFF